MVNGKLAAENVQRIDGRVRPIDNVFDIPVHDPINNVIRIYRKGAFYDELGRRNRVLKPLERE